MSAKSPNPSQFIPISEAHNAKAFRCGVEFIDKWLFDKAVKDHDRFKSRVRVSIDQDSGKILAFHALRLHAEATKGVDGELKPKVQAHQSYFPCVYLQFLAVDRSVNHLSGLGLRLGEKALLDAILRAALVIEHTGGYCLMLEPYEGSEDFYAKYNFAAFGEGLSRRMVLPQRYIQDLMTEFRTSPEYDSWLRS